MDQAPYIWADPENFVRGDPTFFFLIRGKRIQIALKVSHLHASKGPFKWVFRWQAAYGPTLNAGLAALIFQGIQTSIA